MIRNEKEKKVLEELKKKRMTSKMIADKFNIPIKRVYKIAYTEGIKLLTEKEYNKQTRDLEIIKEVQKNEKNYEEIGKMFNLSGSEISNIARKHNVLRTNEVKNKITRQTNLGKYGVENPAQSKKIQKKIEKTCLKKYGVKNVLLDKQMRKKIEKINIERYGNKIPSKSDKVKEKTKQYFLEKFGTENPFQNEKVKEKIRQTNLDKYGVENPAQNQEIKEKIHQTNIKKYGVDNPFKSKKIRNKIKKTMKEKYGVEYGCQLPQANYNNKDSEPNKRFEKKIVAKGIQFTREYPISNRKYDFKVGNILVEINPSQTHNSTYKVFNNDVIEKKYHYNKSRLAAEKGFHCIHIWDWDDQDKIIKLFLQSKQKVYARECEIKEINKEEANIFLELNHLQGKCRGNEINIGLYHNNNLVEIMTFGSPRYNKNYEYELLRLCSSKVVIGGSEKIFKYFLEKYKPKSVISYCDYSKFNGDVYKILGFELKTSSISKHWYNENKKIHITDNLLKQRGFDQLLGKIYGVYGKGTSNIELIKQHGFVEVYDAGQQTWVYEK